MNKGLFFHLSPYLPFILILLFAYGLSFLVDRRGRCGVGDRCGGCSHCHRCGSGDRLSGDGGGGSCWRGKRKGFDGSLKGCELLEMLQYKCEVEKPVTRESVTRCWPIERMFRR